MMKIYFVRHGQTKFNSQRLIQGRIDEPLNKVGIKQAKESGQIIKGLNFNIDKIVTSPLSRAFETAHLIARKTNYKDNIEVVQKFVERDFGKYELTKIADSFPKVMADGFTEEGFEDSPTLIKRIKETIDELYQKYQGKTIIATVHAHVIRTAYILFDNKKYNYVNFFLGNCSIHEFDYDGNNLTFINDYNNEEE